MKNKCFIAILLFSVLIVLSACANSKSINAESTINSQADTKTSALPSTQNTAEKVTQSDSSKITESEKESAEVKNIKVLINGSEFVAELTDSVTAQQFIENLPLTLNMNELNGNEKYYYLDFSMTANPFVPSQINAGDIMLYGDNCLVLFYKSFTTTYSYTPIAHITNAEQLTYAAGENNAEIKFEIIQ